MASTKMFILVAIVALVAPQALAKEFIVGDDKGWTINFDYQAWAQGKDFRVGDELIFKYPEGAHNVHKVDGAGFQQCVVPTTGDALKSGNDVITLTTPGRKWYLCGVGQHCAVGKMKLAITVLPQMESPASSPSAWSAPPPSAAASSPSAWSAPPPSAATDLTASKYFMWIAAAFSIFMMITV